VALDAAGAVDVVIHTAAPVTTAADCVVPEIGRRLSTRSVKVLAVLAPVDLPGLRAVADLRDSLATLHATFCAASQTGVPTGEQLSSVVLPVVLQAPATTVVTPSPHPPACWSRWQATEIWSQTEAI